MIDSKHISVALSGGGCRATVWGLGVLVALHDLGLNTRTRSVTSVSGGSIANAWLAKHLDYSGCTKSDIDDHLLKDLARRVAHRGFLPPAGLLSGLWLLLTGLSLLLLVVDLLAILVASLAPGQAVPPAAVWCVPPLALVTLVLVHIRSRAMAWTFAEIGHFDVALSKLPKQGAQSIFCATSMLSGLAVYYGRDLAYTFSREPIDLAHGRLTLARVLQASAAFPGAFPAPKLGDLYLSDGGAYDNMADEWAMGFERRAEEPRAGLDKADAPDFLVVANASARDVRRTWGRLRNLLLPIALIRQMNLLYDNTTPCRRKALIETFDRAALGYGDVKGMLVHIETVPADILTAMGHSPVPGRAARAEALGPIPAPTDSWEDLAERNSTVPTKLGRLSPDTSADLLFHAYTLTWVLAHVLHDVPVLKQPRTWSQFKEILQ